MKALNTKERNSAILRFALWLLICVVIICVPIIISAFVSAEQEKIVTGESADLVAEVTFEQEYIAVKIQDIIDLMESKDAGELDVDNFNASLTNIFSDIIEQTESDLTWRGDMYRNMVDIAEYLIAANKIVSATGEDKEKQISDLDRIILEMESVKEDLADLNDEKKKKDIYKGLDELEEQFSKALKMLNNYKAGLK